MNILCASPFVPWPLDRGPRIRLHHLLRAILPRHRVTLVAFADHRDPSFQESPLARKLHRVVELDVRTRRQAVEQGFQVWAPFTRRLRALASSPIPSIYRLIDPEAFTRVLREVRGLEDFDLVWAVRPPIGEMARAAGFRRIFLDLDDLEWKKLGQSLGLSPRYASKPLHYAELAKTYAYERMLAWRFDRLAVCKEMDRDFYGRDAGKVLVIPNGAPEQPATDPGASARGICCSSGRSTTSPTSTPCTTCRTRSSRA